MKVVKKMSSLPKQPADSPLFAGDVNRQVVFQPSDSQTFNFGIVNFSAGSRNKFHKHTSDQILVITEGTVEVHVKHILSKLGFRSRSQVVSWYSRQDEKSPAEDRT